MGEPCKQEPIIHIMNTRQTAIDEKLDHLVKTMESIAAQRVEIQHLAEQGRDTRQWLKDHETRLQVQERKPDPGKEIKHLEGRVDDLEKQPGKNAGKALWMFYGASLAAGGSVVSGLVVFWLVN